MLRPGVTWEDFVRRVRERLSGPYTPQPPPLVSPRDYEKLKAYFAAELKKTDPRDHHWREWIRSGKR